MGKALIFDGNSILNRAFYGVRPLNAPDGLPTNALFGFVGMINKSFSQIGSQPDYAVIAFDLKEKTFRHEACDFYKATRKPMPEDLALQLPFSKELATALGLKVITVVGFEADDILGTLSKKFTENGDETFIVTGDRDSFQLINDKVTVLLASNDDTKVTTPKEIKEKYCVEPRTLIDVKAIMGDSSDNIPGVPGIGEKGAIKLICQYGSLDNIYAHVDEISGSIGNKLRDGKESAYISRFLAEINLEVPLGCELDDCRYNGSDVQKLRELYTHFGFRQFLEKLDTVSPVEAEAEEIFPLNEIESVENKTVFVHNEGEEVFIFDGEKTFAGEAVNALRLISESKEAVCWSVKEFFHLAKKFNKEITIPLEDISLLIYVSSPADNGVSFGKAVLDNLGLSCPEVKASLLPSPPFAPLPMDLRFSFL
jgi:DNA polymerase-1